MDNVNIYICTHCDFNCPVSNKVYKIIDSRDIFDNDTASNGIDAIFYSELLTYKYLLDREEELPKYVGFCGYRKYFSFLDEVPNIESIINDHGCIATTLYSTGKRSVYEHYAKCFSYEDMDIMKSILKDNYPDLSEQFNKMLSGNKLYICNMFILKKEDFIKMMNIVWDCLEKYLNVVGYNIKQRILDNKNLYLTHKSKRGSSVAHQYRIGGNLGERIISAYLMKYFPNAKTYDIIYTENPKPHKSI